MLTGHEWVQRQVLIQRLLPVVRARVVLAVERMDWAAFAAASSTRC